MSATPAPLPRTHVPCRRCGRGVLVAPYLGAFPVFIRCANCYRDVNVCQQPRLWREAA
ncbi:MAG TPA: hypothetical protein VKV26_16235 [Dehalococcoidia bacterium]|nr:hypothetical protein [Dehalococcoidia bacterium]